MPQIGVLSFSVNQDVDVQLSDEVEICRDLPKSISKKSFVGRRKALR